MHYMHKGEEGGDVVDYKFDLVGIKSRANLPIDNLGF